MKVTGSGGAPLQDLYYGQGGNPGYDQNGNVTRIENLYASPDEIQEFGYDSLDRLTSAKATPLGQSAIYDEIYEYDSSGRLTGLPALGTYTYPGIGSPHYHAVSSTTGGGSFVYDDNGSMTSRTVPEGGSSVTYALTLDQDNRIVDVNKTGSPHMQFVYDGSGTEGSAGNRVKALDEVANETIYYIGSYFEVTTATPSAPFCRANLSLAIPDNNANGVTDSQVISGQGNLADLNLSVKVNHNYVGQLKVFLTHGETTVTLIDRPGNPPTACSGDNIDAILDDEAASTAESACSETPPALGGYLRPNQVLSAFDGQDLDGTWTLKVFDLQAGITGTLVEWCLYPTFQTARVMRAPLAVVPQPFLNLTPYQTRANFAVTEAFGNPSLFEASFKQFICQGNFGHLSHL